MTVNTAQLDRGFTIEEIDDNRTRISGKGPGIMGLGIGGVIMFAIVMIILASSLSVFSVTLALVVLVGAPLLLHITRSRSFAFDLTDTGIEVDGKLYPTEDISKVFVYNKAEGGDLSSSAYVYDGSIVGNGSVALTNAAARRGARMLYRVGFVYGRKRIILAKNITQDTAESLFDFLTDDR